MAMEAHVEWASPAALWSRFDGPTPQAERRVFRTPAILRFSTDSFMPDFIALMQTDPRRMSEQLAAPERWSSSVPAAAPIRTRPGLAGKLERARKAAVRRLEARPEGVVRAPGWNPATELPLKLFHPASQRYYLVTACLICRTLGLPDRPVDTSAQERVSFVIRMLQTPVDAANPDPAVHPELALVDGAWRAVDESESLLPGEEQYALSPLTYVEDDGRRRRLLNGVIPVAKREALLGAPMPQPAGEPARAMIDPRQMLLKQQVMSPWASLEEVAARGQEEAEALPGVDLDQRPAAATAQAIAAANDQLQAVSWLILLDLARWLRENLEPVWRSLQSGRQTLGEVADLAAYDALDLVSADGESLLAALRVIESYADTLESVKTPAGQGAGWPPAFRFVEATAQGAAGLVGTPVRQQLESALADALREAATAGAPVSAIAQLNAVSHVSPWFTVRCVYERPLCTPLAAAVVSEPTAAFQLASFFDPDAPARPIRVELPADTTPAGLRKFDKNTAFVMSDVLCGQVGKLRSLTFGGLVRSVLPWPLHKSLNVGSVAPCSEGMVCSFSIPIITLCALMLLMMIVKLLDSIFFWMPFFQVCLPAPKFDAKRR